MDRLPGVGQRALDGMNLLEALKAEPWYVGQAMHVAQVGSRNATYATPMAELHPLLKERDAKRRGINHESVIDSLRPQSLCGSSA